YNEAAEASFKIWIDSIISGFKSVSRLVPVIGEVNELSGTPSTTQRGFENRLPCSTSRELYPRIVIAIPPPPGEPEILVTSIPATRPCNKFEIFEDGIPSNSLPLIVETEPVAFLRVVFP